MMDQPPNGFADGGTCHFVLGESVETGTQVVLQAKNQREWGNQVRKRALADTTEQAGKEKNMTGRHRCRAHARHGRSLSTCTASPRDASLREHIEFLEQQGIAGVSHHSLLLSKIAVLPTLSEHDALDRLVLLPPTHSMSCRLSLASHFPGLSNSYVGCVCNKPPTSPMMARQYNKASSLDYIANGAFEPKDGLTPTTYSTISANSESLEEIKAKINQLSQTLSNTTLVSSRLPDRGEKIKKQIHDLDLKLTVMESSPESSSSRGAPEVICLD